MADVPPEVAYGEVVGHFVRFIADTGDAGDVPDEVPLAGKVILKPLTVAMRWPTTTPPRLGIPETVACPVVNGDLTAPSGGGRVFIIATDQPSAEPPTCQWQATFVFDGVTTQPSPVIFNVPANGVVDLSQAVPIPPEPPSMVVVSTESEAMAKAWAETAETAADSAAVSASVAADWAQSGNPGASGTVSVEGTTTLAAGSPATVTDSDPSPSNASLTFGIPQGDKGIKGDKGDKGDLGPSGVIVLSAAAPVPGGTPAGTIVLRTAT